MTENEVIYENEGQSNAFGVLVAGGIAIGILIVIIVIMNVISLQTWANVRTIVDINKTTVASDGLGGTVTDENYLAFKQYAFSAIGSGFSSYGTLGSFIPVVVIVVVAALVLALLGGFGRGAAAEGGMGL